MSKSVGLISFSFFSLEILPGDCFSPWTLMKILGIFVCFSSFSISCYPPMNTSSPKLTFSSLYLGILMSVIIRSIKMTQNLKSFFLTVLKVYFFPIQQSDFLENVTTFMLHWYLKLKWSKIKYTPFSSTVLPQTTHTHKNTQQKHFSWFPYFSYWRHLPPRGTCLTL